MRRPSLWRRWRGGAIKVSSEPAAGGATCRYLAIIMDGNGRWAQRRHVPVAAGHRAGARALRRVVEHAIDRGILEFTAYTFSTENWSRSPEEVAAIMDLFLEQVATEVPEVQARGARVRFLGRREGLDERLTAAMQAAEAANPVDARMTLYIAFNYGSRAEILDAVKALVASKETARDERRPVTITEDALRARFYAPEMHDPELLIRTSGEQRVSNFLLWQLAYSELLFVEKLWPDFGPDDLDEALETYAQRQRRFGGRG
jgi:undecaprenyl diphosphate synthase